MKLFDALAKIGFSSVFAAAFVTLILLFPDISKNKTILEIESSPTSWKEKFEPVYLAAEIDREINALRRSGAEPLRLSPLGGALTTFSMLRSETERVSVALEFASPDANVREYIEVPGGPSAKEIAAIARKVGRLVHSTLGLSSPIGKVSNIKVNFSQREIDGKAAITFVAHRDGRILPSDPLLPSGALGIYYSINDVIQAFSRSYVWAVAPEVLVSAAIARGETREAKLLLKKFSEERDGSDESVIIESILTAALSVRDDAVYPAVKALESAARRANQTFFGHMVRGITNLEISRSYVFLDELRSAQEARALALESFEKAIVELPHSLEARVSKARALLATTGVELEREELQRIYRDVMSLRDQYPDAEVLDFLAGLASSVIGIAEPNTDTRRRNYETAISLINEAVIKRPLTETYIANLGKLHQMRAALLSETDRNRYADEIFYSTDLSIKYLSSALEKHSDGLAALLNLGEAILFQAEFIVANDASAEYQRACARRRVIPCTSALSKLNSAIELLERAATRFSDDIELQVNLIRALQLTAHSVFGEDQVSIVRRLQSKLGALEVHPRRERLSDEVREMLANLSKVVDWTLIQNNGKPINP